MTLQYVSNITHYKVKKLNAKHVLVIIIKKKKKKENKRNELQGYYPKGTNLNKQQTTNP